MIPAYLLLPYLHTYYFLIHDSFHQKVLLLHPGSAHFLIVEWHLLPREVEGGGHGFVTDLREGCPAEGRESAVAGGGTGDHPIVIGAFCLWGDDLAVDDAVGLRAVLIEVFSGGDALPHVLLVVDEHPVFDVLGGGHLGVNLSEYPGPGVVFEVVGVCMGGGVHCW